MDYRRPLALLLLLTLLTGCMARPEAPAATLSPTPEPTPTSVPTPEPAESVPIEGDVYAVEAGEFISLRISDSTRAARIARLPVGTRVRVLQQHSRFARVETADGLRGYALREYLVPVAGDVARRAVEAGEYTVICRESLTLRENPRVEPDEVLGRLEPGSCVTATGRVSGAYAEVCADDLSLTGWVRGDYLTPGRVTSAEPPAATPAPDARTVTVRCKQYLTLREQPDADAQALDTIPAGAQVGFDGEYEGAFARVTYAGRSGWVLSGYLETAALPELAVVDIVQDYPYADMLDDCEALAARYPQARVTSIGTSKQGRELIALVIGDEGASHHILIQAAMHGREHMTALLVMAQAEALLQSGELPQDVCLHILPMTNPDGVTISQTQRMTDELRVIYERDAANGYTDLAEADYLRLWKANAVGVDLNRNFDADFRLGMQRSAPSSRLYPGKRAENQPESRALADYVRAHQFDLTVSYHAYGSCIYWQYGEGAQANAASRALAGELRGLTGYTLRGDSGTEGGGFKDWALSEMGIPSVTIEIGTRACPLPLDEFSDIWARNQNVLPTLCRYVTE
ncbi:MAG: M14 family zinc carboxypeptidase [Candidatus Spyradocola sp.]